MSQIFDVDGPFTFKVPDTHYCVQEFEWSDDMGPKDTDRAAVFELWLGDYTRVTKLDLVSVVPHPEKEGVLLAVFRNPAGTR